MDYNIEGYDFVKLVNEDLLIFNKTIDFCGTKITRNLATTVELYNNKDKEIIKYEFDLEFQDAIGKFVIKNSTKLPYDLKRVQKLSDDFDTWLGI